MARADRAEPWRRLRLERFGLARANTALDRVASGHVIKALIDPALDA
jgi:hypothetical protein